MCRQRPNVRPNSAGGAGPPEGPDPDSACSGSGDVPSASAQDGDRARVAVLPGSPERQVEPPVAIVVEQRHGGAEVVARLHAAGHARRGLGEGRRELASEGQSPPGAPSATELTLHSGRSLRKGAGYVRPRRRARHRKASRLSASAPGDAAPSRGMTPLASIWAWKTGRPSRICRLTASVRPGEVARASRAIWVSSSITSRNTRSNKSSIWSWFR